MALLTTASSATAEPPSWARQMEFAVPAPPNPNEPPATYPQRQAPLQNAQVELGRHLFYDVRLSTNGTVACGTCHRQERAFTDGRERAIGATGMVHPRNTPGLSNSAWSRSLGWAGESVSLAEQHRIPLFGEDPVEHGLTPAGLSRRLRILGRQEPYLSLLDRAGLARNDFDESAARAALAQFVASITSWNSPWDLALLRDDRSAFGTDEMAGMRLFASPRLGCANCHASVHFGGALRSSDTGQSEAFHNTGLYNLDGKGAVPDAGRMQVTGKPEDRGAFRTPSLRNVALTAPYMHDGSLPTLDAVLDHYARGGLNHPTGIRHPQQRSQLTGFELSREERRQVIAFLSALTDEHLLNDPRYGDPFSASAD